MLPRRACHHWDACAAPCCSQQRMRCAVGARPLRSERHALPPDPWSHRRTSCECDDTTKAVR
jgi:hypothetical protein